MSTKGVIYLSDDTDDLRSNRRLASGPDIATAIRRSWRKAEDKTSLRYKISELLLRGSSNREMYEAGLRDGRLQKVDDLTDILYHCQQSGLGRVSIVQESNSHMVLKVFDCACCHEDSETGRCFYVAGFLAGALVAAGKSENVNVKETSCGEYPGRTCVFTANW